jgi:phage protein D
MSATAQNVENRHAPIVLAQIEPEGGKAEPIDLSDRVISFTYQDSEKKADKLTMTVDNFTGEAWDEATFKKGNIIRIRWGYPGYMTPEREVVITGAKGGQIMTVEAKAKSVLMHRKTVCETYEDALPHEVVEVIADRNGFGADARRVQAVDVPRSIINQPNISDARMLSRLAHKYGFEFFIDFDGLHWHERDLAQSPKREFRWYNGEITNRSAIIDYNVENDLTAKPAKTTYRGINPKTKKPYGETGSNAETQRTTVGEVVEVLDFETGEWKQETRSASEEEKPSAEDSAQKAKKRADGRFRKVSQRSVHLTLVVIGDPLLLAKTLVFVTGIAKRLTGRYYVKEVTHAIANGYQMTLKLISDGSRGHTGVSVQDALFPPSKSGKGTGDPFGAALNLARVLNDAQDFMLVSAEPGAAGVGVTAFINRANSIDVRVTENPGDTAAFRAAETLGKELISKGKASGGKGLVRTGRAIVSAAVRGRKASEAARSKGELNTKGIDEDPNAMVLDPETAQWVPKSKLRGTGAS